MAEYETNNSATAENTTEDSKKITFRFCRECSNMLYPKEDRDNSSLMFACRTCQFSEPATASCIWRNSLKEDVQETAGNVLDVAEDPTLPHSDIMCKMCRGRDAVFFQSQQRTAETGMALFYNRRFEKSIETQEEEDIEVPDDDNENATCESSPNKSSPNKSSPNKKGLTVNTQNGNTISRRRQPLFTPKQIPERRLEQFQENMGDGATWGEHEREVLAKKGSTDSAIPGTYSSPY
ncbi:unnamed protein product [Zymoseptoria tritici ST99CH_1A5]|uniref:DNA-directed RNA polymerase II subunit RPB9 n=2 Tax=Zymoseptoria tritici TaxID=1047171 RepID=A0A2H1G4W3_ZYMTR|nr:unnamed protein product [Zymoseptoria tritici ST99CH_1E4]SMR49788.1 unnamed protein product [Zymoseptoria tritici ST99CH_3D1]SMY22488.1 unnamed protein product [Zymoseptoria tritici ST99CH_1A5]